jgi:glycosyltransferase involved in cell wall biosynthesis
MSGAAPVDSGAATLEPSVLILCNRSAGRVDAIRDASAQLARALRAEGARAAVSQRTAGAGWPGGNGSGSEGWDVVLLQYNPFLYGRWGFAPWLVLHLWRLRLRRGRRVIALMVHEPYVPMTGWRWMLMGLWQRTQLALLRAASDVVFASIEVWTEHLHRLWPARPTAHLPVGSNLPDRRDRRVASRHLLQAGEDELVLATLSSGHPSHELDLVQAALAALAERGRRVLFLVLGAGAAVPERVPPGVRVVRPGELSADDLAASLAAADLFMAPLVDGVSTRRTTAMAALQHGLPVVATDGPLTDDLFRKTPHAIHLVPAGRPALFAAEVVRLAERPAERASLGSAAEVLYRSCLDWPVSARRLLQACGGKP